MHDQVRDAARQVQTNQKRVEAARASRELAGAEARRRAEEARRRHLHQLLRVPGAARPRAGAHQRAPGDLRLQPVARRLRGRAGGAAHGRVSSHGANDSACAVASPELPSSPAHQLLALGLRPQSAAPVCVRLPPCRSSRSPSSRGTKPSDVDAALESVAWADEIIVVDSGSTDDTVAIARPVHAIASTCATGPATSIRRITRRRSRRHDWILSLDADERVTPALAAEIRALLAADPPQPRLPHPARHVAPRPLDPHHRLVPRLPAAPVRPPRGALDRALRPRVGRGRRAGRPAEGRAAALCRTATSPITSRRSIATRRMPRGRCTRRAPARGRSSCAVHPPLAFLRNYSCAAASATARAVHHLGAERVLRVPEVREAVGASNAGRPSLPARPSTAECSRSTSTRRGPGAAGRTRCCSRCNGLREHRPPRGARRAPGRRAAPAGGRGTRPHSARAADRDGPDRRVAARRVILQALPPDVVHAHDPHGVAMASLALLDRSAALAAPAGLRRVAPRRLPPERELVLAVEVPPGRLLHRGLGGHPPDARGRRRAAPTAT